jgi:hypothetical protein
VICDFAVNGGERENVVVVHGILVAIVIVLDIGCDIVGWIDIELAVEDVSRGIGCVESGDEWFDI